MILYPTTVLFQPVATIQRALDQLRSGKPMSKKEAVSLKEYESIVGLDKWATIEKRFGSGHSDT